MVENDGDDEERADDQQDLNEVMLDEGEVAPKEFDYLLTMPLWSLSQEKIDELTAQMRKKKDEHDALAATPAHQLWENDLVDFLEAL